MYLCSSVRCTMKKVLFLDTVHPLIAEMLTAAGFECIPADGISKEAITRLMHDVAGLIVRSRFRLDESFLDLASALEFIGRVGAGMENIDVTYCQVRGIRCFNSPEGNRDAVGEHTLGMLLSIMNHLNRADRQIREGKWNREGNRGTEIKGKTVGIIGYGNMGSAFAQRLKGFEANVISYDKYKEGYSDGNTMEVGPDEVFRKADIVSLHVPYNDQTHHLVNDIFLDRFRKPVILINTSRGKVVDTRCLVESLRSGKVTAAALDVLEFEDNSFEQLIPGNHPELDYLLSADNVILTPHIAGWTRESAVKLAAVLAEKIIAAIPSS